MNVRPTTPNIEFQKLLKTQNLDQDNPQGEDHDTTYNIVESHTHWLILSKFLKEVVYATVG